MSKIIEAKIRQHLNQIQVLKKELTGRQLRNAKALIDLEETQKMEEEGIQRQIDRQKTLVEELREQLVDLERAKKS